MIPTNIGNWSADGGVNSPSAMIANVPMIRTIPEIKVRIAPARLIGDKAEKNPIGGTEQRPRASFGG
jgi:hypothetical protein